MDDDGGDWFSEAANEPEPAPVSAPASAAAKAGEKPQDVAPAVSDSTEQAPVEAQAEFEYLDPDKLLIFKHWIRPKFLQYNYLYDYRHNYYDDVIDYLDKRQRGLNRDIPRAQTWAERALRTYTNKTKLDDYYRKTEDDLKLVTNSKLSGSFYHFHSKRYVYKKYFSISA
ncbi:hypothetical protein FQA39_LY14066 [Lamprigera yunnana]|nr:hypothetical protein FQA39_LY14066 [Lamprigera yunnana]